MSRLLSTAARCACVVLAMSLCAAAALGAPSCPSGQHLGKGGKCVGHAASGAASESSGAAIGGLPNLNICVLRGDCPPATSMACKPIDCPFTGYAGGQIHTCQECQLVSSNPRQPIGTVGPSACKVSPRTPNCKQMVIYTVDIADWSQTSLGDPGGQGPGFNPSDHRAHRGH